MNVAQLALDNIEKFGELLHENWQIKKELGDKISNPHIDSIYDAALSAGAIGGKLSGAGGGGFMVLFVPPSRQKSVVENLNGLVRVPFKFESSGSQVIFFEPEEDFEAIERLRAEQNIMPFRELETMAKTGEAGA